MTGSTQPAKPLSINAILVIAALCASASVLVVPKATLDATASPAITAAPSKQPLTANRTMLEDRQIQRDLTANLTAIGREASVVFGVVDAVATAATS